MIFDEGTVLLGFRVIFVLAVLSAFQFITFTHAETEFKEQTNVSEEAVLNQWIYTSGFYRFDGVDEGPAQGPAISIYRRDRVEVRLASGEAVFFNCITAQASDPVNDFDAAIILDATPKNSNGNFPWKYISGRLTVGDRTKVYRWKWSPSNMIVSPVQDQASRRLLNAAIKGERVSLNALGGDHLGLELPQPNADFATFYKACPVFSAR
ncbi:MAG: hypothetical protein AAGI14_02670 [Pseudomonadota bacterium]